MDRGRGTGRTTRQIRELPRGSVFIVHSYSFADYCRHIVVREHGDPKAIRIVVVQEWHDVQKLRGLSVPEVCYDHDYIDLISPPGKRPPRWLSELFDVMDRIRGRVKVS